MGRVSGAAVAEPAIGRAAAPELRDLHQRLRRHYGPQRWWPAGTELEMIVGAILVQNTAWTSARKALDALIGAGLLDVAALLRVAEPRLAEVIRPSGYFNSKARKLKAFAQLVAEEAEGDLTALLARPLDELRPLLLATHGFGPETADTVCLYAARQRTFPIDAYTRRILGRLGWIDDRARYEELRALFMSQLPPRRFAEHHALLVRHAKSTCKKRPRCGECPLLVLCPTGQSEVGAVPGAPLPPAPGDWSD